MQAFLYILLQVGLIAMWTMHPAWADVSWWLVFMPTWLFLAYIMFVFVILFVVGWSHQKAIKRHFR